MKKYLKIQILYSQTVLDLKYGSIDDTFSPTLLVGCLFAAASSLFTSTVDLRLCDLVTL